MRRLATWLALVKFSHSVFALPFVLISAWLASGGVPEARVLLWTVVAAVAARTAAMAFNRWLDREIDAQNPRTAGRELPRGALPPGAVLALVVLASLAFVGAAFALNRACGWLSFPVLGLLLSYSAFKRFSWSAHLVLGACLGVAPLGAWLAVTGSVSGELAVPLLLSAAVLCWVAGFDLIYACQDAEFDARSGLCSIPARFGVAPALRLSSLLHGLAVLLLVVLGRRAGLGPAYWAALLVVAVLFVWQHRIVSPRDLSRVDMAFFTLNGWVGVGLFAGTALDLSAFPGAHP
jgi:4-hydroxybenzoate polyprenyltransferase